MRKLLTTFVATVAASAFAAGAVAQTHPDLTGVWMAPFGVHAAGFAMSAGSTYWDAASTGDPRKKHIPTLDEIRAEDDALNARLIASGGNPGLVKPPGARTPPAMTEAGRAAYAAFDPKVFERQDLSCYPFNVFTRLGGGIGALDIVQGGAQIMMATELNGHNFPRIIYLDGRSDDDAFPSYEGFSVGRWNGRTLHIVTTKIKGDYFNINWPVSQDAVLTEDYTVVGSGPARKLEILQTLVDKKYYTEPLMRVTYADWRPDLVVHDFPCEEGKDDQVELRFKPVDGKP